MGIAPNKPKKINPPKNLSLDEKIEKAKNKKAEPTPLPNKFKKMNLQNTNDTSIKSPSRRGSIAAAFAKAATKSPPKKQNNVDNEDTTMKDKKSEAKPKTKSKKKSPKKKKKKQTMK